MSHSMANINLVVASEPNGNVMDLACVAKRTNRYRKINTETRYICIIAKFPKKSLSLRMYLHYCKC